MDELMRCPFCGGKAELNQAGTMWSAGCEDAYRMVLNGCSVAPFTTYFYTKEKAIEAWNSRLIKPSHNSICLEEVSSCLCNSCQYDDDEYISCQINHNRSSAFPNGICDKCKGIEECPDYKKEDEDG